MIGEADEAELIDPSRATVGDAVLLIGGIAVEGTALLAAEFTDRLESQVDAATLDRCRQFLYEPGISVVVNARRLRQAAGRNVHALHDPTEGGLATGLHEVAEASGCGIDVWHEAIYVHPETTTLCRALGVDPLGLIASGALLAAVDGDSIEPAIQAFAGSGVPAAQIGVLTSDPSARTMRQDGVAGPLPVFEVDEIARLFAASQNE
jgi:hydrogenase expression/formation protein HypE